MWSFLSSLFSPRKSYERDLSFFSSPQKEVVQSLIRQRNWDALADAAAVMSSDELSRLLDGICLTDRNDKEIAALAQTSESEFARLVLGAWYLYRAWQARTGQWAENLSKTEMEGFEHYLLLARLQLGGSFATDAYRCEARARLVRVEMGLSEPARALAAFHQSVALDAKKFWAHHHAFKLLSPKWLGDEETLVAYIQSVEEDAVRHTLWLMFLVEMYSDADLEEEATAQSRWYGRYENLVREVLQQPTLPIETNLTSIYANNHLAYLYHVLGEQEKRNALLDALAGRFPPYPWAYFGIESAQDSAMLHFRQSAACPRP